MARVVSSSAEKCAGHRQGRRRMINAYLVAKGHDCAGEGEKGLRVLCDGIGSRSSFSWGGVLWSSLWSEMCWAAAGGEVVYGVVALNWMGDSCISRGVSKI